MSSQNGEHQCLLEQPEVETSFSTREINVCSNPRHYTIINFNLHTSFLLANLLQYRKSCIAFASIHLQYHFLHAFVGLKMENRATQGLLMSEV